MRGHKLEFFSFKKSRLQVPVLWAVNVRAGGWDEDQQAAPALLPPSFLERAGALGQPFAWPGVTCPCSSDGVGPLGRPCFTTQRMVCWHGSRLQREGHVSPVVPLSRVRVCLSQSDPRGFQDHALQFPRKHSQQVSLGVLVIFSWFLPQFQRMSV